MKTIMVALYGVGFCAAVAGGVWLGTDGPAEASAGATQNAPSVAPSAPPVSAVPGDRDAGLWAWGTAEASKPGVSKANKSLDVLLSQAMRATNVRADGDDPRDTLRKLAQDDPAVMTQLMESYDRQTNSQTRDLIVSLLSGIEKPEVVAFSKRLASSRDMAQRKDGFTMLQNLSSNSPDVHAIILQTLSGDKAPEVIVLALATLKPPANDENNSSRSSVQAKDEAAIVAQLQHLTRNADPNIRLRSILQLAQWDKTDSSQEQWTQALADQSPQVRQAAVTAIAQSGTRSDTVKAALLGLANNPSENKDVRGNALQVLESFTLSQDEAASFSQLRSQILGS